MVGVCLDIWKRSTHPYPWHTKTPASPSRKTSGCSCHTNEFKHNFLSFFKSSLNTNFVLRPTASLYSIIQYNLLYSHTLKGLQMLSLALIPKQQEFKSPSSLTHRITSHPQPTFSFFSNIHRKKQEGRKELSTMTLLNIHFIALWFTQWVHRWMLAPGRRWAAKEQHAQKQMRKSRPSSLLHYWSCEVAQRNDWEWRICVS